MHGSPDARLLMGQPEVLQRRLRLVKRGLGFLERGAGSTGHGFSLPNRALEFLPTLLNRAHDRKRPDPYGRETNRPSEESRHVSPRPGFQKANGMPQQIKSNPADERQPRGRT